MTIDCSLASYERPANSPGHVHAHLHETELMLVRRFIEGDPSARERIVTIVLGLLRSDRPARSDSIHGLDDARNALVVKLLEDPARLRSYRGRAPLSGYLAHAIRRKWIDGKKKSALFVTYAEIVHARARSASSCTYSGHALAALPASRLTGRHAWEGKRGRPRSAGSILDGSFVEDFETTIGLAISVLAEGATQREASVRFLDWMEADAAMHEAPTIAERALECFLDRCEDLVKVLRSHGSRKASVVRIDSLALATRRALRECARVRGRLAA